MKKSNVQYGIYLFIFDIVIGFICGLLGLLHILEVKKEFVSNTGLIGLFCGIIGFALTLVYVIFNGLVFTNNYTEVRKRDENGAFAELDAANNKFKCLYYDDSGDKLSVYAKFSDLNKKQYNYNKDLHKTYESTIHIYCRDASEFNECQDSGTITYSSRYDYQEASSTTKPCPFLYFSELEEVINQDNFDRFLTTLILTLIVCLANIGLVIFGFLLFRTPSDF